MKTKKQLEEAIKDTITTTKRLFLVQMPPPAWRAQMKLMEDTMRKLAWEGLQKNIVRDGHTMIDKRTGEVLNPDVNCTYWKGKFETDFYSL